MTMVLIPQKYFIHLLGKTGTGKSGTGNTILGRKAFSCKSSTSAVTKEIQREISYVNQRQVEVVDGPGLVDVNTGVNLFSLHQVKSIVEENKDCVHVFLMIWRYGDPFSSDDCAMLEKMRKVFGPLVFQNHGIILMTCGDNFRADTEDTGVTFDSWCKSQGGTFSELLKECKGRVVLMENSRSMAKRDQEGLESLGGQLDLIDPMSATGVSLEKSNHPSEAIKRLFEKYRLPGISVLVLCTLFYVLKWQLHYI